MPGYLTQQESIAIPGVADLHMQRLLDRSQFADPLGAALAMGISSAAWPLFGLPWPSGALLAAQLALRVVTPGERILEIGCGLALASLVAHRRGADVTASDCHPLAGTFLRHNLHLNGLPPMKYRQGFWAQRSLPLALSDMPPRPGSPLSNRDDEGHVEAAAEAGPLRVRGQFELIIGSDVLYERDARGELAGFIHHHCMPKAEVWIVDPNRGNRGAFNRHMANAGFARSELRLDHPAAGALAAYKGRLLSYRR